MRCFPLPQPLPLLAALALALSTASAPALAEPAAPTPALAGPGAEVRAGQVVELWWGDLPAGVEEMEILLSLDDGQHYSIRVSPELDAHERRYRWRVPNLPAARARLRMRIGTARAEIETEPTSPFRISAASEPSPPQSLFHEGTFWTGLEAPGSGAVDPDVFSPVSRLDAAAPGTAVAEAPSRDAVEPFAQECGANGRVEPTPSNSLPPVRPAGGPEFIPQRN